MLERKFHHSYVLALFTSFYVVAPVQPIMAKLSVILRSERVNTWGFLHLLGKEFNVMMIMTLMLSGLGKS